MSAKKVGVIIGSSRPGRIGAQITDWVMAQLPTSQDVVYELIDLAEWNLPMFNEMMPPMMGQYQLDHTKKWAAYIAGLQGFVVVTPEYNAGYPGVLKNAIDYLKAEWQNKPTLVISYGFDGGLSSNNQLREVFARIGTKATATSPALVISQSIFGPDYKIADIDTAFAGHKDAVAEAGTQLIELL